MFTMKKVSGFKLPYKLLGRPPQCRHSRRKIFSRRAAEAQRIKESCKVWRWEWKQPGDGKQVAREDAKNAKKKKGDLRQNLRVRPDGTGRG
jgi:hypothetical protein